MLDKRTYAMELSIDEAADATRVDFQNKQLIFYVDSFIDFPIGGIVPVGYYDRAKGAWVASDNGVVIKVLNQYDANGYILLDTGGIPLAQLEITDAERVTMATALAHDKKYWRVRVSHLTPWDCNWPFDYPEGAGPPPAPDPDKKMPEGPTNPKCSPGSIIGCENQSLGESIPITGAPFSLHSSRRERGELDV